MMTWPGWKFNLHWSRPSLTDHCTVWTYSQLPLEHFADAHRQRKIRRTLSSSFPSHHPSPKVCKIKDNKKMNQRIPKTTNARNSQWEKRKAIEKIECCLRRIVLHSCILRVSDHFTLHLGPVDVSINLLVYLAANNHIVTSNQIESVLDLRRWLVILWSPDNTLHGFSKDEVGKLVCWKKSSKECATINGED